MSVDDKLLDVAISIDVDTGRRQAGPRRMLLDLMTRRLEDLKGDIKEKTIVDLYKPFSPGLWYATRAGTLDVVAPYPRYRDISFQKGDPLVVLRCAGFHRGIGSWWWVVDKEGKRYKVLWRYQPPFVFEWEKSCP